MRMDVTRSGARNTCFFPSSSCCPSSPPRVVFFFYPAGEALMGSFYMEDSFGLSKEFV